MYLDSVQCRGFRCLAEVHFEPGPGINIIRGENAQGKTSLLEAILFAATSKSHRTNLETDLVRHGEEGFHIRLHVVRKDRDVTIETHWWRGDKRVKVNGVPQTRMSDILGKVRVIFLAPEDIALVKGSASIRRKFLDMELSQLSPAYLNALQQYRQVLRQRNELLRTGRPDLGLLDVWDEQLVRQGRLIIHERAAFTEELGESASEAHRTIAHSEELELSYQPDTHPGPFPEVLVNAREMDIKRRQTTRGPHRDDIALLIAGETARSHASQGQQKSAALAIKLAELRLIHDRTEDFPILMLDEVLAELDDERARHLFDAINKEVQCILTTTELHDRRKRTTGEIRNFIIRSGRLTAP